MLTLAQDLPQLPRSSLQLLHSGAQAFHHPGQELALRPELSGMGSTNGLDEFRRRSQLKQASLDTMLQGRSDELLFEAVGED